MLVFCLFIPFPHGYKSIPRGPRIFARNDRVLRTEKKKFCLLAKNGVIDLRFLFYPVQRALFAVAFVAKYERYIVAHDAKEFQKTFRLGHGKVARQYRRNGQGKICEFNDVEPRKFHKAVYVFVWKLVRNGETGRAKWRVIMQNNLTF